jgi:hypothetical protein
MHLWCFVLKMKRTPIYRSIIQHSQCFDAIFCKILLIIISISVDQFLVDQSNERIVVYLMTRARCTHMAVSSDLKRSNVSKFYSDKFPKDSQYFATILVR